MSGEADVYALLRAYNQGANLGDEDSKPTARTATVINLGESDGQSETRPTTLEETPILDIIGLPKDESTNIRTKE